MSVEVLQATVDLGLIFIHQLEAWVTKRTVVETVPGSAASPRMSLAGSDAKSYANLLTEVVGGWEGSRRRRPPSMVGAKIVRVSRRALEFTPSKLAIPLQASAQTPLTC